MRSGEEASCETLQYDAGCDEYEQTYEVYEIYIYIATPSGAKCYCYALNRFELGIHFMVKGNGGICAKGTGLLEKK